MKVVFVGPSLTDARNHATADIEIRPPARQGDVMLAIAAGARSISIIDGLFEFVAPVWHKELLYALSKGIPVFGAASMGALRAVECAPYGMIGIGRIYDDYAQGRRFDDGDVALLHGPSELSYPAITVALVNVDATLEKARGAGLIGEDEAERLAQAARRIFFKDRSWRRIAAEAEMNWSTLQRVVDGAWTDQKRLDALLLIQSIASKDSVLLSQNSWTFNATPIWRHLYP